MKKNIKNEVIELFDELSERIIYKFEQIERCLNTFD